MIIVYLNFGLLTHKFTLTAVEGISVYVVVNFLSQVIFIFRLF